MQSIPKIIQQNKVFSEEKISNQSNLFENQSENHYEKIFEQLQILPFKKYQDNKNNEGLVAGTLMSIQEKKTLKGTPYAIAKFSDKYGEFELFLFSEILISNRDILKEGESFVITLYKEINKDQKRMNVKKVVSLTGLINHNYKKVSIEIKEHTDLTDFKELIKEKGETYIKLILNKNNNKFIFELENPRKFDLKLFNTIKNKEYVKKITF